MYLMACCKFSTLLAHERRSAYFSVSFVLNFLKSLFLCYSDVALKLNLTLRNTMLEGNERELHSPEILHAKNIVDRESCNFTSIILLLTF